MIKVDKINKSFNQKDKILNNVSFYIDKGESVAIIGKSGTGKSVLLKHLAPNVQHFHNSVNLV